MAERSSDAVAVTVTAGALHPRRQGGDHGRWEASSPGQPRSLTGVAALAVQVAPENPTPISALLPRSSALTSEENPVEHGSAPH